LILNPVRKEKSIQHTGPLSTAQRNAVSKQVVNDEPVIGQGDIVSIPFGIDYQPVIVTVHKRRSYFCPAIF